MSREVLFQMDSLLRQSLIAGHTFYVEEAQKRLLSQFKDIGMEADKAAEEYLNRSSESFDPDRHDPADFYERANDVGIEFYGLLSGLWDQTQLSVIAGMFHEWEKQLREWLVRELQYWYNGEILPKRVWSANFKETVDLLESFGWKVRESDYHDLLDACRVVVNVYKHGDGGSFKELKEKYPEYLPDPSTGTMFTFGNKDFREHSDLVVSEEQFSVFSGAIISFWENGPKNVLQSDLSTEVKWVEDAIKKDSKTLQRAKK